MKQIPTKQLVSVSSLITAIFWIYGIFKNNYHITQLITDFQVSWLPLTVNFIFLVVWFAVFTLFYRFANTTFWIGKILVYMIGMYFSLLAHDVFFVPLYYLLSSFELFNKSGLLNTFSNALHKDLYFCMALIFIVHEGQLILINRNTNIKLKSRIFWLILMIAIILCFVISSYFI